LIRDVFRRSTSEPPPPIRWVPQEEGMGCAVACLAMLMGESYWSARSLLPFFDPKEGTCSTDVLRVLGEYGWAYASKYPHYSPERRDRRRWPVRPFAPIHFCAVRVSGWHAVLMLGDGDVIDPLRHPQHTLTLDAYPEVLEIHGLWRVR
jgi:hypothetical protein